MYMMIVYDHKRLLEYQLTQFTYWITIQVFVSKIWNQYLLNGVASLTRVGHPADVEDYIDIISNVFTKSMQTL